MLVAHEPVREFSSSLGQRSTRVAVQAADAHDEQEIAECGSSEANADDQSYGSDRNVACQ